MNQIMKTQSSILFVVLALGSVFALTAQELTVTEPHDHSHYPEHDSVAGHKLMYPSKTPDRIIANLTVDPAHSFAVNWRTDQQVAQGVVEIAVATDGPEFLLGNMSRFDAETELFENQNRNEPLVKAAYHSAVISDLQPRTTYVYRVGSGSEDNNYWSEWFQFTTAGTDMEEPFSFIYFGDAQNNIKSLWSRVIRNSYR